MEASRMPVQMVCLCLSLSQCSSGWLFLVWITCESSSFLHGDPESAAGGRPQSVLGECTSVFTSKARHENAERKSLMKAQENHPPLEETHVHTHAHTHAHGHKHTFGHTLKKQMAKMGKQVHLSTSSRLVDHVTFVLIE